MADIRWDLLNPVDVGSQVQQGFKTGSALVRDYQQQHALNALSVDPSDPSALSALFRVNPDLAVSLEKRSREMQARSALADYALSGGDTATGALGAFGPAPAGPAPAAPTRSPAFERAMRADPEATLKFQGQRLDVTKKQLEGWRDLNDAAMQLLGGVHDQASYDAAKEQAADLYAAHGMDIAELNLPGEYSPEVVQDLQMRGMDTAKQLQAVARENRLDWDIQDDVIDNEETRRYHDEGIRVRERGQDLYSRDRRRGQDLTNNRSRRGGTLSAKPPTPTSVIGRIMDKQARGEGLTPAEQRTYDEYRAGRGRSRGGSSGGNGAIIRNPKTGERLQLKDGRWVPIK